jgi:hypothetical protein
VPRSKKKGEHPIEGAVGGVGSDYSDEERVFLQACDRYRIQKRLPFLALTDVLFVVKQLGYRLFTETHMAKFLRAMGGGPHSAAFDLPADIEQRVNAVKLGSWDWSTFWKIIEQYGVAVALNVLAIVTYIAVGNYAGALAELVKMEPATAALVLSILAMLGITIPVPPIVTP